MAEPKELTAEEKERLAKATRPTPRLMGLYQKPMVQYPIRYTGSGNVFGVICYFTDHLPQSIGEVADTSCGSSGGKIIRLRCARCKCVVGFDK